MWDATVPLRVGENVIKFYESGVDGCWSLTVTRGPSFSVSGTVAFNGIGQLNIELTLVDASDSSSAFDAYTDESGSYRFTFIPTGTYTLTPADECLEFTPESLSITGNNADDMTGTNFGIPEKPGATISGRVTDATYDGMYSVGLVLSDASTSASVMSKWSNLGGYFTFTCVADGAYVITPQAQGLQGPFGFFEPESRSVTIEDGIDVPGQDFHMTQ